MAKNTLRIKYAGGTTIGEDTARLFFDISGVGDPDFFLSALSYLAKKKPRRINFWTILYFYMVISGKLEDLEG